MKISNISTMVMGTPWRNLLFVKVETDEGLVGWGEARPVGWRRTGDRLLE